MMDAPKTEEVPKKGEDPILLMPCIDLINDDMCKPLFHVLMGIWNDRLAQYKLMAPTKSEDLVTQCMMTLVGEEITIGEKCKVVKCPGLDDSKPYQVRFQDWVKQLLRIIKGRKETPSQ